MTAEKTPEDRLLELGIDLPDAPAPVATYVNARRDGHRIYLSGKGPLYPDGRLSVGKVGTVVSVETAYQDARMVGINLIAALKAEIGSLDRLDTIVKLLGLVNGAPEFGDHPKVVNGCSDLLVEVFGERGRHARSAMGAGSLPNNITVEIEMIVRVRDD